jgi:hypothetical protein
MSTTRLYTGRINGLDYRVWLAMFVLCIICFAWVGYNQLKVKGASNKSFSSLKIAVDGKESSVLVYPVERLAIFQVLPATKSRIEWEFDDGSPKAYGRIIQHRFQKEGNYIVTAMIDGQHKITQEIVIKNVPSLLTGTQLISIHGDSFKTIAGSQIRLTGVANFPVQSYTWRVLETNDMKEGETVFFSFPAEGKYQVQLIANNDITKTDTRKVEVVAIPSIPSTLPSGFPPQVPGMGPYPPPDGGGGNPKPPKPFEQPEQSQNKPSTQPPTVDVDANKRLDISEETFKELLQSVLNGKEEINRLYDYLDLDETTSVSVNGSEDLTKLKTFCQENKKQKIETLKFKHNDKKEISRLDVKLKSRGFFKKILGKD